VRKLLGVTCLCLLMMGSVGVNTAGAKGGDNTVTAEGEASFAANERAQFTFHWDDDSLEVARLSPLTARDAVTPPDLFGGGHTFTIVKPGDVPRTVKDVFENCFPDAESPNQGCAAAAGHFETDPPTPVINAPGSQEGLDAPGDSMLVPAAGSVSAKVSAPRGTTLHFICTFHPWMQGTLHVE
jgi:hypothetical protein